MKRSHGIRIALCPLCAALALSVAACGAMPVESTPTSFTEYIVIESTEIPATYPDLTETTAEDDFARYAEPSDEPSAFSSVPTSLPTSAPAAPTLPTTAVQPTATQPVPTQSVSAAHVHIYTSEVIPPTCLQQGYTRKTCVCGDVQNVDYTHALGHDFGSPVTVKAPTCTEGGSSVSTCSRCGAKQETTLPAAGHQMSDFIVVREATHEAAGLKTKTCARCGRQESEEIPRLRPYDSMEKSLEMLRLMNEARADAGVEPLTFNYTYYPAAELRSHEIEQKFSHTRPNGKAYHTALGDVGIERSSGGSGENIQMTSDTDGSPLEAHNRFMNSQGHRENMLRASYKSVSICVLHTDTGTYTVEMFFTD